MKGHAITLLIGKLSTEQQLRDVDYGYRANIETAYDHRLYSRRLTPLLAEEMSRALQAMRKHMEACRLPKGTRT